MTHDVCHPGARRDPLYERLVRRHDPRPLGPGRCAARRNAVAPADRLFDARIRRGVPDREAPGPRAARRTSRQRPVQQLCVARRAAVRLRREPDERRDRQRTHLRLLPHPRRAPARRTRASRHPGERDLLRNERQRDRGRRRARPGDDPRDAEKARIHAGLCRCGRRRERDARADDSALHPDGDLRARVRRVGRVRCSSAAWCRAC